MAPTRGRYRRVRLVLGSPHAGPGGLQEAFVAGIRRLKEGDPLRPIHVLVGSNWLRLHLQRLLAVRMGGHANISFLLLRDLADRLGTGPLVDKGRRRLPEFGRDLLMREAVAVRSKGTYFERIATKEGFVEALGATIRDLKEAGVEPAALRAAAAAAPQRVHAGKLEDLADLYETYDDLLRDRRFHDDEDLMRSAVAEAAAPSGPAVVVYGFYDATWLQRRLIQETLSFRDGVVFFPFDPRGRGAAFEYARPMLAWLRSFVEAEAGEGMEEDGGDRGEGGTRREAGPAADPGSPRDVAVLSAPGEARELAEVVRWLVSRAREASVPFGEMALLFRTGDPYLAALRDVIEDAGGVPCFVTRERPLASTAAARALMLLLQARRTGLPRGAIIDFLSLTVGDDRAALWDRLSREAGIVKGIASWRDRLAAIEAALRRAEPAEEAPGDRASGRDGSEACRAIRDLRRRVDGIHEAIEALPREATWREMAERCAAIVGRLLPPQDAVDAILRRLDSVGALDEVTSPVRIEEFEDVLRRALDAESTPSPAGNRFQRSGIFVGDVMEARLLAFHSVAIVGLVERGFPMIPRQDPILLDDERESVNEILAGEDRLALKARRLDEERLLFRLAATSAAENLLLSYPRLDAATARPRSPSPFLLAAASALEGRDIDTRALEDLPRTRRLGLSALAPADPGSALLGREFDLAIVRDAIRPRADKGAIGRVISFLHSHPVLHRAIEAERARWGEPRFTVHDGVILRPSVLDSLRSLHRVEGAPLSASRVEDYATCPLRYFLAHVIGLGEIPEPEDRLSIDPMRKGTLVHGILCDVFARLREKCALPIDRAGLPAAIALLDEACRRAFAEEEARGIMGYPLHWEVDKERIREDLTTVLAREAADDSGFRPALFEVRYGMDRRGDEPEDPASIAEAVPIDLRPGRTIALRGRIDRIDVSPDGSEARVTDYKTGRIDRYTDDSLDGGRSVQLSLYMLAAERILAGAHPGIRAREARYLSVDRKGGFQSRVFTGEALARRRGDVARVLATFIGGVARGVFFAYPDPETCRRCEFRLACGEGREARLARKRGDATAADFLRMREGIA